MRLTREDQLWRAAHYSLDVCEEHDGCWVTIYRDGLPVGTGIALRQSGMPASEVTSRAIADARRALRAVLAAKAAKKPYVEDEPCHACKGVGLVLDPFAHNARGFCAKTACSHCQGTGYKHERDQAYALRG